MTTPPVPAAANNEVRRIACASWDQFISEVRLSRPLGTDEGEVIASHVLSRGHCCTEWKLQSILDRNLTVWGKSETGETILATHLRLDQSKFGRYCERILQQFRRSTHGMPGTYPGMPDDELWALGRHHGLLTPLLDWTESPYVAAYFAFAEQARLWQRGFKAIANPGVGQTVRIWGLRFWLDLDQPGEFQTVRAIPSTASRQRAQRGLFTQLVATKHFDLEDYLRERGLAHCLETYDIPASEASTALRDLRLMNITPVVILPRFGGHHPKGEDGVHGGAEKAACSPQVHT